MTLIEQLQLTFKDWTIVLYGHSYKIHVTQMESLDLFQELFEYFIWKRNGRGLMRWPKIVLMFMSLFDQDRSQISRACSFKITHTHIHSQYGPADSLLRVNETESRAYKTWAHRLHTIKKSTERNIRQQLSAAQRNIINSLYVNVNYIFVYVSTC